MFKQCLLAVVAAGLISGAAAQDNPSPPSPPPNDQQSGPAMGGGGRGHHGPPDPAERTQELTRKLSLTSDQQTKVLGILQSERSQMDSLRQDSSTPQQDRRAKMMDIHKSSETQIRTLLDATQQKKWDEMQARREQWGKRGGPGGGGPEGGDQQGPPPQQ